MWRFPRDLLEADGRWHDLLLSESKMAVSNSSQRSAGWGDGDHECRVDASALVAEQ